jgi:hypothetical protein
MVQTDRVPPDETLWHRYSPHHELSFSMTTSAAVHVVGFALLIAAVAVVIGNPPPTPPKTDGPPVVEIGPGTGDGAGPGRRGDDPLLGPGKREVTENPDRPESKSPGPAPLQFETPREPGVKPPDAAVREPSDSGVKEAVKKLDMIRRTASNHLRPAPGPRGDDGLGNKGKDGGVGDKPGSGGPAGRIQALQERRAQRWVMHFNTHDGRDYRKQLADLSAHMQRKTIVAVQRSDGRFLVYRDLGQQPPVGRVEDVDRIGGIRWWDEKPESIASLSRALGLGYVPARLCVFFSEELEQKLLRLELQFAGRTEEQIEETHFEIVKRGGVYEPVVAGQR